jgi:hypothetical protein
MEVSSPAWDTLYNKEIYAISPKYNEYASQYKIFDHKLQDKFKEDNNDEYGKNKRYKCMDCGEFVVPHRGLKNRWHFQHHQKSQCKFDETFFINGESDIHKLAKYKLSALIRQKKIITIIGTKCQKITCSNKLRDNNLIHKEDDEIKIEYIINNKTKTRADVAIINNNEIRYIFEVYHTSKTKSDRPDPWFEIKASEILECNDHKDIITLNDIKDYDCKLCNPCQQITSNNEPIILESLCSKNEIKSYNKNTININDIAKELGYLYIEYPYACKANKLLEMAIKGKYEKTERWNINHSNNLDKKEAIILWKYFLQHRKCMRCEKSHETSFGKPFCKQCYIQIKREEKLDLTFNIVIIKDTQKFLLRDKFKWLKNVPGGWSLGDKCFFCNENYDDIKLNKKYQQFWNFGSNYVNGYTWYFGDKKCCCTVCLYKQCIIKGIL